MERESSPERGRESKTRLLLRWPAREAERETSDGGRSHCWSSSQGGDSDLGGCRHRRKPKEWVGERDALMVLGREIVLGGDASMVESKGWRGERGSISFLFKNNNNKKILTGVGLTPAT
jgi:hypothetical protein